MVVSSFQWHRTGRPNPVKKVGKGIQKGVKKLKQQRFVCSSDLRLHICIGPEIEYIDNEERECSYLFGKKPTKKLLDQNNLMSILRGH